MPPAMNFCYLDNAATSWPKPEPVVDAIAHYYRHVGVAAGRGSSARAAEVDRVLSLCRTELARLLNASPDGTVFCFNGTDGLNMAIQGLISDGDHVVTSVLEHNSVLRPLQHAVGSRNLTLDIVGCVDNQVDLNQIQERINRSTRLCCITQVSNVTGVVQPIAEIARICQQTDTLLLVDACQSVGHVTIDFQEIGCDVLVSSGHKGLLGPLGTGFLCLSERAADEIRPSRFGGTGTHGESLAQPTELPFRLESGNLNAGGIFGLLEGVRFVASRQAEIVAHEGKLNQMLIRELAALPSIALYGCDAANCAAMVSFNINQMEPQTVAAILDSEFQIQVRSGFHCAPSIHRSLGTDRLGGTVRISPGFFNTESQIKKVIAAIQEIAHSMSPS